MSAGVVNLQEQVESVLGALVKAATVELTKLFESKYQASAVDMEVGRNEDKRENETLEKPDSLSTADTKRSIGVQVDDGIYPRWELSGSPLLSDGDCLGECKGEVAEKCFIPPEILPAENNGHVDPEWSPLKEQVLAGAVEMVELSVLETESPADSDAQTEVVLHGKKKTHSSELKSKAETH